jgi:basic amino acid/polyamine antiporter, APA family
VVAMARDRHLPRMLSAVRPRFGGPHRAETGFSSFAVLGYYAIASASAWTLRPEQGRPTTGRARARPDRYLVLAFSLPVSAVRSGRH